MTLRPIRLSTLAVLLAAALFGPGAAPAQAGPSDPLFLFVPVPPAAGKPAMLPTGYLNGPCGLAVDSDGDIYVSDYYHDAVDVFSPARAYKGQLSGIDPLDGPCGLALGPGDKLYVNDFHRRVSSFGSFPAFAAETPIAGDPLDSTQPTGVATGAGRVYVNQRTYVGVYEADGSPALDGEGEPLRIGAGSLGDGYGVAVSAFPATAGYVYVPDAAGGTVKVYDPAADVDQPIATIDGGETPEGRFVSLRDSAVAVDRVNGDVYVVDDLQPQHTEQPLAIVHVFAANGTYKGHLKHLVVNVRPAGLAVDNSNAFTQGRVYVTTGNSNEAGFFGYPAGAATKAAPLTPSGLASALLAQPPEPPNLGEEARQAGDSAGQAGASERRAEAETIQRGRLRLTVSGGFAPRKLPREGTAPIALSVAGRVATSDGSRPPQLQRMQIEFNRHGRLETRGLAVCPAAKIRVASSARALSACRAALVGQGSFEASVALSGQEPYLTTGRLLLFNGSRSGKPVLFGHLYAARPFANSFLIEFRLAKRRGGTFGTVLTADLPQALGSWGHVTAISMRLFRRYAAAGGDRSFLSAGCPAPAGFPGAVFPLARAGFSFAASPTLTATLVRDCVVRNREGG